MPIPTDVADAGQVEAAADRIEQAFGPIDIWVNNAMVTVFSPFDRVTPEEFKRVTEVNYLGYVYGTMAALKRMLPRDRGVIVQVGSALADRSIPLQSAYCGAKHAIEGFTDSIRSELIHRNSGVQITMVQMPAMNTPQFSLSRNKMQDKAQPVPPIYQPEVGAQAVAYAARHPSRQIRVGWSTTKAMAGQALMPGMLDEYLARKGYTAQQTEAPRDANRPDNLFAPVPGDHGTHGDFDDRALSNSKQLWARTHPKLLMAGAVGLGLAATLLARTIGSRNGRSR